MFFSCPDEAKAPRAKGQIYQGGNTMERNYYGEIINPLGSINPSQYDIDLWNEACCLITTASQKRRIAGSYDNITFDRRRRAAGDAVHHEIYDIAPDGRRVLLCVRSTEGTKYGVRTTWKQYFILSTHGRSVRVQPANKAKAAKAAKQAGSALGDAIAVCLGQKKLIVAGTTKKTGYKIAGIDLTGNPVSVYDGSPWPLGKTRREAASMDHTGGYYVFPTIPSALAAWKKRVAFAEEWVNGEKYILLECECSGRMFEHDHQKMCVTSVRPTKEIAGLLIK
jgi:hypothetical protein